MPEETKPEAEKGLMYNKEDDILFFTRGKPGKQTIEIADFILDVDKNSNLVGIEILNASKALGVPKSFLSSLDYAKVKTESTPNALYVKFLFASLNVIQNVQVPLLPSSRREPIMAGYWITYPPISV